MNSHSPFQRCHEIDWRRFPAVVFESDDWGACETTRNSEEAAKYAEILNGNQQGGGAAPPNGTLESIDDLERLYRTLERFRGVDGHPAVFSAFVCTGNPDYAAIRATNFVEYVDIGIDQGVPLGWERGDLATKWRDGIRRGVWAPEFHSNLHHTSPVLLMRRLQSDTPEGVHARSIFALTSYYQGAHLPEYEGMNALEQHQWVNKGVERFTRAVGRPPNAAVTSDAYPITETIWAVNGIKTVCLKNSKMNTGEVVVYHSKPWNNQNVYVNIGSHDPVKDLIYLTRNVWFENVIRDPSQRAKTVADVAEKRWKENEPAVISTHRVRYVSLRRDDAERGYAELEKLLMILVGKKDVCFLSTAEVSDLYRKGWSTRETSGGVILRNWSENSGDIILNGSFAEIRSLPDGGTIPFRSHGSDQIVASPPLGDFLLVRN